MHAFQKKKYTIRGVNFTMPDGWWKLEVTEDGIDFWTFDGEKHLFISSLVYNNKVLNDTLSNAISCKLININNILGYSFFLGNINEKIRAYTIYFPDAYIYIHPYYIDDDDSLVAYEEFINSMTITSPEEVHPFEISKENMKRINEMCKPVED